MMAFLGNRASYLLDVIGDVPPSFSRKNDALTRPSRAVTRSYKLHYILTR